MINIASSQPVHLPMVSTPVSVPGVTAIGAIEPTRKSPGDGQSNLGSRRQALGQAPASQEPQRKKSEESDGARQAAPILPRDNPKDASGLKSLQPTQEARQQAEDAQAAQEAREEKSIKLMDVLSSVWKASAAVVDNALGRNVLSVDGQEKSKALAPASDAANNPLAKTDLVAAAQDFPPSVAAGGAGVRPDSAPPVAYTEQGASEWNALELGQLVSKRA